MRYSLQTTLQVILEGNETFEKALARLKTAMHEAVNAPEYATVEAYSVDQGIKPNEIRVSIQFNGMPATNVEDTATEILETAIVIFNRMNDSQPELVEESVRLQTVFA